jgi:hypothetical protein
VADNREIKAAQNTGVTFPFEQKFKRPFHKFLRFHAFIRKLFVVVVSFSTVTLKVVLLMGPTVIYFLSSL